MEVTDSFRMNEDLKMTEGYRYVSLRPRYSMICLV